MKVSSKPRLIFKEKFSAFLILFLLFAKCFAFADSKRTTDSLSGKTIDKTSSHYAEKPLRLPLPPPDEIENLPADGGEEFNRLIFSSSPYLLQHARNPINWYPWGEEAFLTAKKLNRPIFLSIGYTTCHWCHVMEHESFENHEVAAFLNRNYVSIKVDREERPDLDHIYMSVTQLMTGSGGWPTTIIMSPEKVPFFAGTYFPKSSMLQLLPHFSRVWKEEREKVEEIGQAIIKSLKEMQLVHQSGDLNSTHLDACYHSLRKDYDPEFGGFGNKPKFPTSHTLSFLLRYFKRTGETHALNMVKNTLKKIRSGGIYDQIGFGIHRYSTDSKWLVPHFEKMLYDQALFTIANLECYLITKEPFYLRSCRDTLAYVQRRLSSHKGGFYSAEDADSEGEEGRFYLWEMDELVEALGKEDALIFANQYQFQSEGNYLDEFSRKLTGKNIPHLSVKKPLLKSPNTETLRKRLFKVREKRVRPQIDDKILTDWNGLMISAFARCAGALGDSSYLITAKQSADFCLKNLRRPDGKLVKRWRQGKAGLPSHLDDYAFLIQGLIDLYEASLESQYLIEADQLAKLAIQLFEDKERGGFFLTAIDGEKLLVRPKEFYDGAIPSGNSVMALNLARLYKITGNRLYNQKLLSLFSAVAGFIEKNPAGAEVLLQALDFMLNSPVELVVVGDSRSKETQDFIRAINHRFLPSKILLFKDTFKADPGLIKLVPFLKNQQQINGQPTVYPCRNQTCDKPRTSLPALLQFLDQQN
jgi:uncharacterized protein YyaL (SSP411 family)